MKGKIKKITKKILLSTLVLFVGSALAGIIYEEVGYGFLHGLVIFGTVMGILQILGVVDFFRRKKKEKIKPLFGESLAELIRKITDRDLPTFTLMGLPEATVISVIDGYFCYKSNMPYLADKDIFQRILKARGYDSKIEEEILKANPKNLLEFVELILKAEEQADQLSLESINNLISKYREIRGVNL